jgi:hypothetical protein
MARVSFEVHPSSSVVVELSTATPAVQVSVCDKNGVIVDSVWLDCYHRENAEAVYAALHGDHTKCKAVNDRLRRAANDAIDRLAL